MFDPIAKEVLRQCDGQDGLVDVSTVLPGLHCSHVGRLDHAS